MLKSISIPPLPGYHQHLQLVLCFFFFHFVHRSTEKIPELGFEYLFNMDEINVLIGKFKAANSKRAVEVTEAEILLLYSGFVCMNKMLVSSYDEMSAAPLTEPLAANHPMKNFVTFRDDMINSNNHLILDTEKKYQKRPELIELMKKLSLIEIA